MKSFVRRFEIPNAQISVVAKDGRLVFSKAYTNCVVEPPDGRVFATPEHRFRIASVTKLFTAIAILQIIEGRVGRMHRPTLYSLDDLVYKLVDFATTMHGRSPDSRLDRITVDHLLCHLGGWDRSGGDEAKCGGSPGDVDDEDIAYHLAKALPVDVDDWMKYVNSQPLGAAPGTCSAYSNYGYQVLGKVIEAVTSLSVEDYFHTYILDPVGASNTLLGFSDRPHWSEVRYYVERFPIDPDPGCNDPGSPMIHTRLSSTPVFRTVAHGGREMSGWQYPGERDCVYYPWGVKNLSQAVASGGWISTTNDLLRVLREFLPLLSSNSLLLDPASIETMFTPYTKRHPMLRSSLDLDEGQAIGWNVSDKRATKSGHINGNAAYVRLRRSSTTGFGFAVLINRHPFPGLDDDASRDREGALYSKIADILSTVVDWGMVDLYTTTF